MNDKGLEIFIPYRKDWENGKSNKQRELRRSPKQSSCVSVPGKNNKNLSSIDFSDEDFIVFTLEEDGAVHRKPGKHDFGGCTHTNSGMPISRKLISYGIDEDKFHHINHDNKSNTENTSIETRKERESVTSKKKKVAFLKVKEKPTTRDFETKKAVMKTENQEETSGPESSDSNQSDASSGSFAFPILSWEGRESPAKMPKPESLHFWKHKKWGVLCLCKRF